ncbi:MAG: DUF2325 domain-containing protein [Rhodocyclaceae bacterium]
MRIIIICAAKWLAPEIVMCLHPPVVNRPIEAGDSSAFTLDAMSTALQASAAPLRAGPRAGSRRRKLWELNHRQHCPVIGTCLPMDELRRLARRAGLDEKTVADYALHVHAVSESQTHSDFAAIIQRALERRFAPVVGRFSALRDPSAVLALWRETVAAGEVAGALWAALTHPACDDPTDKAIYGEIHMLSHQVGAGHRADLKRLALVDGDLARISAEAGRDRERAQRRQNELALQLHVRDAQLAEARCALSEQQAVRRRLEAQGDDLQRSRGVEAELRRRAEVAERRLEAQRGERIGLQRRLEAAEAAVQELLAESRVAEAALGALCANGAAAGTAAHAAAACGTLSDCSVCPGGPQAARLDGRCLLCIGGRENLVGHYRGLVEGLGGRFLHHDGGIEDNPKRLETTLASADAVVCQAGCVSHAAYWKLKAYCKRHNKPCVYLKRSGITSFARGVDLLAQGAGEEIDEALLQ